jgi:flagellar basal body-associated protein FliL
MMNSTQISLANQIGSSMGLLIIILILIAVLAIIIVVGLFQYFVGGMSGRQ